MAAERGRFLERGGGTGDTADVAHGRRFFADGRAHQGSTCAIPDQYRRGICRLCQSFVRARGKPSLDDRCGDHTLRPAPRRVQHRDAGRRLSAGSAGRDRHCRRAAANRAISRRHRRREPAHIDLRATRERPWPAQPCHDDRRTRRHPFHRHSFDRIPRVVSTSPTQKATLLPHT
jgi:hypothetical protein